MMRDAQSMALAIDERSSGGTLTVVVPTFLETSFATDQPAGGSLFWLYFGENLLGLP